MWTSLYQMAHVTRHAVIRFCLLEVWSADTSNSTVLHVDVNCKGSDVGWTETLCLCSKSVF